MIHYFNEVNMLKYKDIVLYMSAADSDKNVIFVL